MESLEDYLSRKYEELKLLSGALSGVTSVRRPRSIEEVIEQKFKLAGMLKAEHESRGWALTETAWANPSGFRSGPFAFHYDYQRADLNVQGPMFYDFLAPQNTETIYTSSGMAAISALLFALIPIVVSAEILLLPGSYGETVELIDRFAHHLTPIEMTAPPFRAGSRTAARRIFLLDSCISATAFDAIFRWPSPDLDLIIFDTTCFSSSSGRLRRVIGWARQWGISLILVRSHTKLDSLGVEYGRLGSVACVDVGENSATGCQLLHELAAETRNTVRLFGGAALPAHFPPYMGTRSYRTLTDNRVAAMLRNCRRAAKYFESMLPALTAELHFAHGLYVTLLPWTTWDERQARDAALGISNDLMAVGLPLRHAGSFGFDFAAIEWCKDRVRDRYVLRFCIADLPTQTGDRVVEAVAGWWSGKAERLTLDVPREAADPVS
jgi:hypothetical protein